MRCLRALGSRVRYVASAGCFAWGAVVAGAAPQPAPPSGDPAAAVELLEPAQRGVHLGHLAREPMLLEHPGGRLFLAGYGSQSATDSEPNQVPLLLSSDDAGSSWQRVDVGTAAQGAIGNSDVDLALGAGGEIYFASMGFDRTTFRGTHIAVGVSHDIGSTWKWNVVSRTELDDRPWVVVDSQGTAHVVWNDGSGVSHALTRDRGLSWEEQARIATKGGSSHFAAGTDGRLALRLSPMSASGNRFDAGVDAIVVSSDFGRTWRTGTLPGSGAWPSSMAELASKPRWVDPLAWVGSVLWHAWAEDGELWLARSVDEGASWRRGRVTSETSDIFFPYLAASSDGRLALSWWFGAGEELRARIAVLGVRDAGAAKGDLEQSTGAEVASGALQTSATARTAPLALEMWRRLGNTGPGVRDTGGEYLPLLWLSSGDLAAATTVQNPARDRFGFEYWRFERAPE